MAKGKTNETGYFKKGKSPNLNPTTTDESITEDKLLEETLNNAKAQLNKDSTIAEIGKRFLKQFIEMILNDESAIGNEFLLTGEKGILKSIVVNGKRKNLNATDSRKIVDRLLDDVDYVETLKEKGFSILKNWNNDSSTSDGKSRTRPIITIHKL